MAKRLSPGFTADDAEIMRTLTEVANAEHDGHLTVLRFTTNWRVGFQTPADRFDIDVMAVGETFAEAAERAIDQNQGQEADKITGAPSK
jgi:hypothetical protein